jgi:ribonuclease BN (tRNA processing enzyme)
MAGAIKPRLLILSHNMKRATDRQEEGEAAIRRNYGGPMVVAKDLDCFIP